MREIITKKIVNLHGFSYQVLVEYVNSRLIINPFLSTDVVDIYKDYLYYIFLLSEEQKKKNGLEVVPKNIVHFVHQAFTNSIFAVGLISKRNFGNILEKILQEREPTVTRKRSKAVFIQGVGLKSAEGIVYIDSILKSAAGEQDFIQATKNNTCNVKHVKKSS